MNYALRTFGLLLASMAAAAFAQPQPAPYPSKVVRIITTAPGSGTDLTARIIARGLTTAFGHQVIVDNRGIAGVEAAAKSPPDGYVLLHYTSPVWLLHYMQEVRWDWQADFAAVSLASRTPNLVVTHPSLPVTSITQLIALARQRPGELNYATGTLGASAHLSAELFASMAGIRMTRIYYKGSGPAMNDLIAGQVQLMFPAAGTATPHVRAGRLRALAVTTAAPTPLAPGLPTVAQAGLKGYESVSLSGYFAPARTPRAIVQRLNTEIVRILNEAEHKSRMASIGVELAASTPEEFTAMMKSESSRMGPLLRDAMRAGQGG